MSTPRSPHASVFTFARISLVLLLAGCAGERPRDDSAAPGGGTPAPPTAEARRLYGLAEAVFVGQVDAIEESDAGTTYRVRPLEVLKAPPDALSAEASHPVDPDGELRVAEFLFRDGHEPSSIGPLAELSRYVFFVARKERPGEWLNLADAATLRLPEAQAALDDLRLRRKADEERRRAAPPAPDESPSNATAPR